MSSAPHTSVTSATTARPLLWVAILLSVLMAVTAALGTMMAMGNRDVQQVHSIIGYVNTVLGVVAAFLGYRHARATHNMGTFYHALSLPVLMVAQIALGEMGLQTIHISVGVLILVAAVALATLTARPAPSAA